MRAPAPTTPARTAQLAVLALFIAASLSACDRRAEGEAGDRSPETGATTPAPTDTPPSDPASGMGTTATMPSPMTTMPPSSSTVPGAGATLNSADQAFLAEATRSNEEEIATTNLGIERGNAENKALSQKLHDDHAALRGKVAALMPNASPPPPAAAPAELAALRGDEFNTKLLDVYEQQHQAAIRKFTDASNNPALSESVRTLARDTVPTLQEHLKSVQDARGG